MHGEIHDMTDRSEDGSMCKRMCSVEMAICSAISLALMMLSAFALYLLAYVVVPLGLEDGFVIGVCLTAASFCWMITFSSFAFRISILFLIDRYWCRSSLGNGSKSGHARIGARRQHAKILKNEE
jgi:hypothetical protein